MRKMYEVSLWDRAAFGPLAVAVSALSTVLGGPLLGGATILAGKLLGPKAPKPAAATAAAVAPSAPRPAQPFSSGTSSFFGPSSGGMGGTFVTGDAGKPILGGSSGKKTLLGS